MKRLNLFPKTFLYTLCLMLVIVLVVHALIFFLMPVFYKNQQRNMLDRETDILKQQIQDSSEDGFRDILSRFSNRLNAGVKLNYDGKSYESNFYEPLGGEFKISSTLITTDNGLPHISTDETIFINGMPIERQPNNAEFIVNTSSYILVNKIFPNQPNNYIMTFVSLRSVNEATSVILVLMPVTGIICALISIVFSLIYTRTITKPIKHISSVAEQMEKLDHSAKCEVKTSDEIGVLAASLNQLYHNLLSTINNLEIEMHKVSDAEKLKTDFLRAASHELKTPVTAINAMLENMILGVGKYKDHELFMPKCKEMVEQLSNMIKDILDTSRLNMNAENEELSETDIAEFIFPLIEPYQIIAKTKGINFNIDITDSFTITVPQKLFGRAISNILSNAVSYTEKGKSVYVRLSDNRLVIENECTPIQQEEIGRLFEPFYRLEYSRDRNTGGNGLGLYIVDIILKTLRIDYKFEHMENQQGMSLIIHF